VEIVREQIEREDHAGASRDKTVRAEVKPDSQEERENDQLLQREQTKVGCE
jgi:hypothetical protein